MSVKVSILPPKRVPIEKPSSGMQERRLMKQNDANPLNVINQNQSVLQQALFERRAKPDLFTLGKSLIRDQEFLGSKSFNERLQVDHFRYMKETEKLLSQIIANREGVILRGRGRDDAVLA